jgi:hypothetical protein
MEVGPTGHHARHRSHRAYFTTRATSCGDSKHRHRCDVDVDTDLAAGQGVVVTDLAAGQGLSDPRAMLTS